MQPTLEPERRAERTSSEESLTGRVRQGSVTVSTPLRRMRNYLPAEGQRLCFPMRFGTTCNVSKHAQVARETNVTGPHLV